MCGGGTLLRDSAIATVGRSDHPTTFSRLFLVSADDCYLTCEYKHVYSTQVGRYISDRLLPTALDYLSATLSVDPIANMTLGVSVG